MYCMFVILNSFMKKNFNIPLIIFILIFASKNAFSQKQLVADTGKCLEFIGTFDGTVKDMEGTYTVKLIKDNKVIEQQTLSVYKQFRFVMRRNMLYAVKLEKPEYITKTVSISTKLPAKLEIENLYLFKLETNLISEELSVHFKDDDIDFPVALVNYGKKCDCFEFNKDYTTKLIKSMYTNLMFGN